MLAVREGLIKDSEAGSISENTQTFNLVDEGSEHLGICQPDDSHQDKRNIEKQGPPRAIEDEWHDTESVNTQEKTFRRDASDIDESALDERSIATRGIPEPRCHWKTVAHKISHRQRQWASLKMRWSKRTGQSLNVRQRQVEFRNLLKNSGPILL